MALVQKLSEQIGEVEDIRANLIALVTEINKKISPICNSDISKWSLKENAVNIKSQLFNYFSLQNYISDDSLKTMQPASIMRDVSRQPMLYFVAYFFVMFIIIYLLSYFLYFNCGRRLCCFFTCGLCLNKRKPVRAAKKTENSRKNDTSNDIEMKKCGDVEFGEDNLYKNMPGQIDNNLENVVNETEKIENTKIDLENIEEVKHNKSKQNTKKIGKWKLAVLLLGLFLMIALITISIFAQTSASASDYHNTESFCNTFNVIKNMLVGSCPATTNNELIEIDTCFTVTDTMDDGILILKSLESILIEVDRQNLLTYEQEIPFLQEIKTYSDKLEKLSNNLEVNNANMISNYKHSLILSVKGKQMIDNVFSQIKEKQKVITDTANQSKESLIGVSNNLYKILDENVELILKKTNNALKLAKKHILDPQNITNMNYRIRSSINTFNTAFLIFILFMVIITAVLCACIYYFIKGNEKKYRKLVRIVGIFSSYFGMLTIFIMFVTFLFTIVSILGSTMCTLSEDPKSLNKIIPQEQIQNIPVLGTCLSHENALLVDESHINGIIQKLENFGTDNILKQIDTFANIQKTLVNSFEEQFNTVADILWIAQVEETKIQDLLNKIENANVKTALLSTHIYKNHVPNTPKLDGQHIVRSIDEFLNIVNPLLLNSGYELCYEEVKCENDPKKYNITRNSSTTDSKYQNIRNYVNPNSEQNKSSLDAIFEILKLKANLVHARVFIVSDITPEYPDKLLINEYIGPSNLSGENNSYIHVWLLKLLSDMRESKHFMDFRNIVSRLVKAKNDAIFQVRKQSKKLNCQVAMKGIRTLKNYVCYNLIVSIMHVTILCFVTGILTFLLWLYFLCLWLNNKMTQEREELESGKVN